MKRFSKILYIALIVVLGAVFLYSAGSLLRYYMESRESQDKYNALSNLVSAARPTVPQTGNSETESTAPVSPWMTITDPITGAEMDVLPEYADAYLLNTDMVGWIAIDDTNINYPVVQSAGDNPDYYLHRDFYKEHDSHGCIYVREQCDVNKPSDNLTIYGHRMKDHTMFGHLAKYEDVAFWQGHQFIRFDTLTQRHTYQIVHVLITTATLGEGFTYHTFVDAEDTADWDDFIGNCKELSLYDTGLEILPGDKLITLSTCEYTHENGRLVIVAKRID